MKHCSHIKGSDWKGFYSRNEDKRKLLINLKLIIAGGRNYRLTKDDFDFLNKLIPRVKEVVSGGFRGVDLCGESWASQNGIPIKRFYPEWGKHGRAAGPIRNRKMAEYADAGVLFPGGNGTNSMRNELKRLNKPIFNDKNNH
jgi:hypothetical protein